MPANLTIAIYGCATFAVACQVISMLTKEHSWVDRLWSITPVLYVVWFALSAGRFDLRLLLMAVLVAAWGTRLTYNFARKGGYRRGGEDYRWEVLRRRMTPGQFAILNVVFINGFQHGLLLLLALPAWIMTTLPPSDLNVWDAIAGGFFLIFLVGETIADQQQWNFHLKKAAGHGDGPGFLSTGLFRYSRHPNFFCEQGIWWSFYLFTIAAGSSWWNVALLGPVLLTLLFHGSTAFTESISASKYPEYAAYRRRTSRLIPWFPAAPKA